MRRLPIKPIKNAETANAFLFGLIFNQNQKAERAWQAPYVLKERLGTLNPSKILKLPRVVLLGAVAKQPALHPFIPLMADYVRKACQLLVKRHGGDARKIWQPRKCIKEVLEKLQEFPGIGKHKAAVGVFVLRNELGVSMRDDGTRLNIRTTCPRLYQLYGGEE